ncbi:1-phosphofructokinase family hexose kinase [Corynebacterium sp. H128]|uniref:1-phosphofructokinase family hexose kinase n=1 Tax=unclassified Corynebacterium TaxID=2624378 RepID=UPI0030AE7126
MILTFTANPSIDCTLELDTELKRGTVHRLHSVSNVAGGKGINVSVAAHRAGKATLAVFPAPADDPFIRLLLKTGVNYQFVTSESGVRTNTTVTEPGGATTKLNGPGPALPEAVVAHCEETLALKAEAAHWLVLAGSLPPGAPKNWYAQLADAIRTVNPETKIAIDTSDAALKALMENLEFARPNVIKPNGEELGQAVGVDGEDLEAQAAAGNFIPVVTAARKLNQRGVEFVLVTLGAAGAVLVSENGAWAATPPPTEAVSTVGAGDSSLAGFVMAHGDGLPPQDCLATAVAYGSAAASLPGTQIPAPEDLRLNQVTVFPLDLPST